MYVMNYRQKNCLGINTCDMAKYFDINTTYSVFLYIKKYKIFC